MWYKILSVFVGSLPPPSNQVTSNPNCGAPIGGMTLGPFWRVSHPSIVSFEEKFFFATRTSGVAADINSHKLLLEAILAVFSLYS